MATTFPTTIDTLTNPTSTDKLNSPSHADQHANANDAIEALQAKVGADSSAVTTSHDYKLGEVTSTDKAVGKTATQTLTNKTLTAPTITGLNISDEEFSVSDNADSSKEVDFELSGATASTKTTVAVSQTANRTITLPDATDTLVGKATTDILTNKTIDADNNTISNIETDNIKASTLVTAADTIAANDNDTTIPTSAAVRDYVDSAGTGTDVQEFTSNGTWTKPAVGAIVMVEVWSAGGSGGAHAISDAAAAAAGQGGGGGAYIKTYFDIDDLGATESVTVGTGGASVTAEQLGGSATDSANGNDGGNSAFGSFITVVGGKGGTTSLGGDGGYVQLFDGMTPLYGVASATSPAPITVSGTHSAAGASRATGTAQNPGNTQFGGAGGGGSEYGTASDSFPGGTSLSGGDGGQGELVAGIGGTQVATASAGSVPAGGGGGATARAYNSPGNATANSGAGGNGLVRVTTF